jgi:hypothetical protein
MLTHHAATCDHTVNDRRSSGLAFPIPTKLISDSMMRRSSLLRRSVFAALLAIWFAGNGLAEDNARSESRLTYERDVRPILKTHCFHCHGEGDELEGRLDVRLRRLIAKGGESGPAIEAGKPAASLLLQRIRDGEMPPEEVPTRPTADEIATIERWIAGGAVTIRDEPEEIGSGLYLTEEERGFWSFQPIQRSEPPQVKNVDRVRTPIDRFLLARLEDDGLSFAPDAEKRTLVRRAYFDLLGLPPTPEEVDRFVNDDALDAYERLLDRLLESPHYGERWGRHWLDVAGYADSEGYTDEDPVRPEAYKYRDYVIRSLNADKPLDQFIVEQLAGDELVTPPYENLSPEDADRLTATGFLRMAPDGTSSGGVDQNLARNDVMAKTIEIVSTSLLGMTVGCAQCHNHRYDPIAQADYYRLRAIFEPALDWKNWRSAKDRKISLYTDADRERAKQIEAEAQKVEEQRKQQEQEFIEQTFQRELAKLPAEIRDMVREARDTIAAKRTPEQQKLLKEHPSVNVTAGSLYLYDSKAAAELKKLADSAAAVRATKPKEEFVRALWEPAGQTPPKTFLFHRGDFEQPKQELPPGELTVLTSHQAFEIPANDPSLPSTGRRLSYARWLTSGQHPLTARVLVNRVWLHHFGRGIVTTPGDFGFLGTRPTHPALLDWLADEFMRNGWSLKKLHRLIMTSTAYRQSSQRDPAAPMTDTADELYARMPVRRLEAEVIRDRMLAVSGKLNPKPFGPAVPVMADLVGQFVIGIENLNAGRPGAVIAMNGEEFRRSVYVQVRRSRLLSVLDTFDAPAMEPNCTIRNASTVAPQSLMLMNSELVMTLAVEFAFRVSADAGDDTKSQIIRAWRLSFAREPSDDELNDAVAFLKQQTDYFESKQNKKRPAAEREAFQSLCHALLSANEFLYVD